MKNCKKCGKKATKILSSWLQYYPINYRVDEVGHMIDDVTYINTSDIYVCDKCCLKLKGVEIIYK